ncbi:peflin [Agrilus planipennis]|uniref:Peflin n=1 Tax=Agrilus planipennis TaxID=224129 RepID=A0A1W4XDT3_AGRPL|nr:peflin [Agrilus planipennis]XP_018330511.1 peflin [Agrilus planipennis]
MQAYPSFTPTPGGMPPEVSNWFNTVDRDRDGKINADELKSVLVNAQGKHFSDACCRLMVNMFDADLNGTINESEFGQLYIYINQWLSVFRTYDRNQSGHIDEQELSQALQQMGFRFTPDFVKYLITRADVEKKNNIDVDQFMVLCVQLQRFTESFRQRDVEGKGEIQIGFEEFLRVALEVSL